MYIENVLSDVFFTVNRRKENCHWSKHLLSNRISTSQNYITTIFKVCNAQAENSAYMNNNNASKSKNTLVK